ASTTGLPGVLLDELVLRLREMPVRIWRKSAIANSTQHPTITYDVDDDEIVLLLPTPAVGSDMPWEVSFDGEVREARSARKWGGDAQSATVRVAIPGPIREIVVSHPA